MNNVCPECQEEFPLGLKYCPECRENWGFKIQTPDKILNCKFRFQCPLEWDKLNLGEDEDIRFCPNCSKNVFFAHSQTELDQFTEQGKCVAFHPIDEIYFDDPRYQPPPLMGYVVSSERLAELEKASLSKENEKSWWQFWK